jgi:hypothetical protein
LNGATPNYDARGATPKYDEWMERRQIALSYVRTYLGIYKPDGFQMVMNISDDASH